MTKRRGRDWGIKGVWSKISALHKLGTLKKFGYTYKGVKRGTSAQARLIVAHIDRGEELELEWLTDIVARLSEISLRFGSVTALRHSKGHTIEQHTR